MSEFRERINKLSQKQLALLALEQNDKVEAVATRTRADCRHWNGLPLSRWRR